MVSLLFKIEFDREAANTNVSTRMSGLRKVKVFRAADELGKLRNLEVELIEVRYIDATEPRGVNLDQ